MSDACISLRQVTKQYAGLDTPVLDGIDLEVASGGRVAVVGPSGCGKSTLLHLIGALDTPESGTVTCCGQLLTELNEKQLASFRATRIGFVFQLHHLLPQCTALENVLVPTLAMSADRQAVSERAGDLLDRVGLGQRLHHRPAQLSGGERQRVAVVRALINQPDIVLADEPTGSLSQDGADRLIDVLLKLNSDLGTTLVVVTHSQHIAERMDCVHVLRQGKLSAGGAP